MLHNRSGEIKDFRVYGKSNSANNACTFGSGSKFSAALSIMTLTNVRQECFSRGKPACLPG